MSRSDSIHRTCSCGISGTEKETSAIRLMMNPRLLPQSERHMSVFSRYKFQPIQVPKLSRAQGLDFSQRLICVDTPAVGIRQPSGIRRVLKEGSQHSCIHHFPPRVGLIHRKNLTARVAKVVCLSIFRFVVVLSVLREGM